MIQRYEFTPADLLPQDRAIPVLYRFNKVSNDTGRQIEAWRRDQDIIYTCLCANDVVSEFLNRVREG